MNDFEAQELKEAGMHDVAKAIVAIIGTVEEFTHTDLL
jgi:hypothetical protein